MANDLVFRVHAIQRMAQRGISLEDVRQGLDTGEVIEDYPDDFPYPSALILGWIESRPIHVVLTNSPQKRIIITVYEPDPVRWEPWFDLAWKKWTRDSPNWRIETWERSVTALSSRKRRCA